MPSNIDTTKPVYGNPTTQSVRDNFTTAKTEITDLQSKVAAAPFLPLTGGIMSGMITVQQDAINPMELITKRYVDNIAFGGGASVAEAPNDGMFYARGYTIGGMTWSKNPLLQSIHLGLDSATERFSIDSDATYNFIKFNTATLDYLRFNRSTKAFELVSNNTIVQSWLDTGIMIYPAVTMNSTLQTSMLTVSSAAATIILTSPTQGDQYLFFNKGALKRWAIGADSTNNTFGIFNYDAAGAIIGKPLSISPLVPGNRNIIVDARGNIGTGGLLPPTNEPAGGYLHIPGLNTYAWYGNCYYDGTNYRTTNAGYGFVTITNGGGPQNLWAWMASTASVAAGATLTLATAMSLSNTGQLWLSNVGGGTGLSVNNSGAPTAYGAVIASSSGGISLVLQNNAHAKVHMTTTGSGRQWSMGTLQTGEFYLADETNGTGYLTLANNIFFK